MWTKCRHARIFPTRLQWSQIGDSVIQSVNANTASPSESNSHSSGSTRMQCSHACFTITFAAALFTYEQAFEFSVGLVKMNCGECRKPWLKWKYTSKKQEHVGADPTHKQALYGLGGGVPCPSCVSVTAQNVVSWQITTVRTLLYIHADIFSYRQCIKPQLTSLVPFVLSRPGPLI